MTTRRDVLIAAAALPVLIAAPSTETAEQEHALEFAYGSPLWIWVLTRQEIVATPHWGAPSVVPSLLDVVAYHKLLPRCERPELLTKIHARFKSPYSVSRWRPERNCVMLVVGEWDDVRELERGWATHDAMVGAADALDT